MGSLELVISIVAGVITVIGGLYAFNQWLRSVPWKVKPSGLFLKEKNIHLTYPNGTTKQVTFVNADTMPILGKSKVVFFRSEKIDHFGSEYTRYKLMSVDINTFKETVISDQKPFADGLNNSFEILKPGYPILSTDQSLIFFCIEKYVTGSELVQVDLRSGKWTELFSVEFFEIINSGKFKNKLLVGVSEARDKGRTIYYKVCDHMGNVLKEFDGYDEYMQFRSLAMIRKK